MKNSEIFFVKIKSLIGEMYLYAEDDQLIGLTYNPNNAAFLKTLKGRKLTEKKTPLMAQVQKQLNEYFKGERESFDVPLNPYGTDFQKKVWRALSKIPYGQTISYGEQARRIGSERAVRAVGTANGRNPISIIVPCHRVISKTGGLTGYAGGLDVKQRLLEIEKFLF